MKKPTSPKRPAKPRQSKEKGHQPIKNPPYHPSKETTISSGSAGAFEATENTIDDQDSDEDNDDLALNKTRY